MDPVPPSPMRPTPEPDPTRLDTGQAPNACLERTRSHVLNVLVAVGLSIAVSGWLLRKHAETWQPRPAKTLSDSLYVALIALAVASYASKRLLAARAARAEPLRRDRLFYWAHVGPTLIAAMAIPLGLAYGWLVSPRLDAVIPFWAVPFTLGFLCLPRQSELDDRNSSSSHRGAASS
jgi:hypothetical protein